MKQLPAIRYTEALTRDEVAFLQTRKSAETGQVRKLLRVCVVLSVLIPFAGAWVRANEGEPSVFSLLKYGLLLFWMLLISGAIAGVNYGRAVHPLRRDLRGGEKVVEAAVIVRKVFMPQDGSYHLYLNSLVRLSIEVEEAAFQHVQQGDEINILYAPYSRLHLGYF